MRLGRDSEWTALFDNDEEYIDYLISVIHGLETTRQRQREMITALEQKLTD